jgi:anti-sigma regulatory factor (Ser/Thr protein kinase)
VHRKFARSIESLASVYEFTEGALNAGQVDDAVKFPVHLAMEELFVNMVHYNPETTSDIECEIEATDGVVTVTLTEYDVEPFDVTQPRNIDVDAPLDERKPGGLGLHLIQTMVDELEYRYERHGRRSRVKFIKEPGIEDV